MHNTEKPVWSSHPRPQMKREKYITLNGIWKCNGKDIRVPFPPQSELSGYEGVVSDVLEYETVFLVPEEFREERVLLHFGAVDQIAEVWVNGHFLGKHEGGYLPFTFDVTDAIKRDGENLLRVKATDILDLDYPYGKQCKKRGGMWYTLVSGVWQTVWLENVPDYYIEKVKITPDLNGITVETVFGGESVTTVLEVEDEINSVNDGNSSPAEKEEHHTYEISLPDGAVISGKLEKGCGRIEIPNPRLWNVDDPYLYQMKIGTGQDQVETYFALRTIGIEKVEGINRVCLNGKPIFLHGVLDQGYFQNGIYLPLEEAEYERDVLRMKELGFNMLRKHIKIEPEAFYYACDRLGMLIVQDMVNNGSYSWTFDTALPTIGFKKRRDTKSNINGKRQQIFKEHMKATLEHLYNHPSIVIYTIFNEGWGQFHSDAMYNIAKALDHTRLYDSTSGWFAQKKNDFDSEHIYFKVIDLKVKERPMFVSECGGYALPIEGHLFNPKNEYGYGKCKDEDDLTERIAQMYRKMILPAIKKGACGCVYTQLSDVEDEVNGLYTYDRQVCKVIKDKMQQVGKELYQEIEQC